MDQDQMLRAHLKRILDWEDAHVNFDTAVNAIPQDKRAIRPKGFPYSLWEILEHIRICQFDILDFCRNSEYKERAISGRRETIPPERNGMPASKSFRMIDVP